VLGTTVYMVSFLKTKEAELHP